MRLEPVFCRLKWKLVLFLTLSSILKRLGVGERWKGEGELERWERGLGKVGEK